MVSLGKILAMIASFIIPVVLTRYLSKEEYGIYGQFNAVFFFIAGLFSLGIRSNLFYFYPNADHKEREILVFQTFAILFMLSIIASFVIITPGINTIFVGKNELSKYTVYIAFAIILTMSSSIIEPLYILRKDNKTSLIYPFASIILKAIIVIVFVVYISDIKSVLIALNIFFALIFLFSIFYMRKEIRFFKWKDLYSKAILVKQIHYSLPFGLSISIKSIIGKLDKILLISYISTKDYAIYTVAFLAIPGIQAIYDSLVQVYIIEMSKAYGNNNLKKIINIYHDLITRSFSYTLPAVLIVFVYAEFVITTLFTDKYLEAIPLFRLYMVGSLSMVIGAGIVLRSIGKTKLTLRSYIFSSFFTIPVTIFSVINYGLWGAMLSAIFALILPKIFLFRFDMRELNASIVKFFPWRNIGVISIISSIALIPVIISNYFIKPNFLSVSLISFSYLVVVFYFEYKKKLFVVDNDIIDNLINKVKGNKQI